MENEMSLTEFDKLILPAPIQMLKAIIPFMEYGMQRQFSLLVRMQEMMSTVNFYNVPKNCVSFKACGCNPIITWNTPLNDILYNDEIVNAVLNCCPSGYKNIFMNFKNYAQMSDLFNLYNSMNMYGNTGDSQNNQNSHDNKNSKTTGSTSGNNAGNTSGNSAGNNSFLQSFMNNSQQKMYDEYIKQLDKLDFNENQMHK